MLARHSSFLFKRNPSQLWRGLIPITYPTYASILLAIPSLSLSIPFSLFLKRQNSRSLSRTTFPILDTLHPSPTFVKSNPFDFPLDSIARYPCATLLGDNFEIKLKKAETVERRRAGQRHSVLQEARENIGNSTMSMLLLVLWTLDCTLWFFKDQQL